MPILGWALSCNLPCCRTTNNHFLDNTERNGSLTGLSNMEDRPISVAGWTQVQIRKGEAETDI